MEWPGIENMQHSLKKIGKIWQTYCEVNRYLPVTCSISSAWPVRKILVIFIPWIFQLQALPAKKWYCRYYRYQNYCEMLTNIGGTVTENSQ
mgnify:CR=1 FL=1